MSPVPPGIAVPLVAVVLTAAIYDVRFRRIPNWLTLTGVILGFALNAFLKDRIGQGLLFAAEGFALAFGTHLVFYMLRFTGGGDVKLMAAVGAMAGPANWIGIFILNAVIGGVLAILLVAGSGRLRKTLFNVGFALNEMAHLRAPYVGREELDVSSPKSMRLPRGVMVALGSFAFLALGMFFGSNRY